MEMAEVMQDRMEEAVKLALLRERKVMAQEIAAEMMTAQAEKQQDEDKKPLAAQVKAAQAENQ